MKNTRKKFQKMLQRQKKFRRNSVASNAN